LDCSWISRPPRASSNAIEMTEEQHVEVRKVRVKRKGKNDET
jgi:hypothetical protein